MRNTGKNRKKRIEQDKEQHTNRGKLEHASRDITMHDKIEQPVHDTEMRYRALFENANDAIFLMEVDKFVECNAKTLEMFGCTPEQIIGKTPYDPYSPEFQPDGRESKEKTLEKIHLAMQGKPQFFEWRHNKYNDNVFDAEVSLNRLEISGKILIQAIVRDITKHRQLEGKLKHSEEKYQTLVEHVNDIIYMHDPDNILTYVSPQCEKITGYTVQELIGQQWTSYATDNPINKLALDIFEEARETGKPPESHQVEIRKKDGDVVVLEVNDSILRNAEGDITGVVGSARNITNQKLMEQALAESEQKFRMFFENEPEYCYMISPQGTILEANGAALGVLGYAKEELIGKPIESLYAPELSERVGQLLSQWKQTGEIRNEEMVIITRNGDRRTVLLSSAQVLGENGKPLHSVSIQRDITERKKAQEELKRSKEFITNIINTLDDPFFVKDQEHRWLMLNDAACKVMGRPREELIGKSDYDLFAKEQADRFWERDSFVLENGRTDLSEEEITWHGKLHTISTKKSLFTDSITGQKFITGTIRDITERKHLEEAYRSLVDNSLQGLAIVQDGRMVFINTAFSSTTGYSKEDLLAASPEQLQSMVHPEDHELVWARHRDRIAGKPVPARYEFRWIRKDGSTCWVEIYASRIEYQGRPAIQTAYIDITERKKTQEALRQSEETARALLDANIDSGLLVDREGIIIDLNDNMAISFGKTRVDMIGTVIYDYLPADLAEQRKAIGVEAARTRKPIHFKDQRGERWLENSVYPVVDTLGEVSRFAIYSRDITERKRMEERVAKSRELFSKVFYANPISATITTVSNDKLLMVNDAWLKLIGFDSQEEAIGKSAVDLGLWVDIEDREERNINLQQEGSSGIQEIRVHTPSGQIRNCLYIAEMIEYESQPHILSMAIDITERKKAAIALRDSEEKYRTLFEAASDGILTLKIADEGAHFVDCNSCTLSMFRCSQEEFIGKSPADFSPPLQPDGISSAEKVTKIAKAVMAGGSQYFEWTHRRLDETLFDAEVTLNRINIAGETYLQAIVRDITERKKAEEALKSEKEFTETAINAQIDTFFVFEPISKKPVRWNKTFSEITGYSNEEIASMKAPDDWYGKDDLKKAAGSIEKVYEEGQATVEISLITKDGRRIPTEYTVSLIKDAEGNPQYMISIGRDITDRKKAQQKLIEYQRQLKSLASELLLAEERERRRIATGVHDDIGQKLALAKLELQSMNEIVSEPDVSASLGHACELVTQAMQDARSLAFDLSNPVLYEVGFTAAVESLLTERMIQKSGVKSEFESKTRKIKLGQDMSIVLFQAVRELLTNVVKHANANKVKVCIDKSDHRVQVIVEDDGVGFELPGLKSPDKEKGGFGLFNVKERLEYLGGSFDIESKPGQGTRVTMAVPLESSITAS